LAANAQTSALVHMALQFPPQFPPNGWRQTSRDRRYFRDGREIVKNEEKSGPLRVGVLESTPSGSVARSRQLALA
jgi:hypothetical protein